MSTSKPSRILLIGIICLCAAIAFGILALVTNIFEKKQEGKNPFFRVVELTDDTEDPTIWGKNFPQQYDGYRRTVDMVRTRYGGSEGLPREPTEDDPRDVTSYSKLDIIPQLKRMWAGYAFAIDFRQARGHAYMLEDQLFTGRHIVQQPGTCINCHASVYVPFKKFGDGDIIKGFEKFNPMPYEEAKKHVKYPISCIDCHDPQTMELRITRPAFIEGIRAVKALEGIPDYDVSKMATHQEMRSFVCAQCHVEYYFQGDQRRLVYPWSKGLKVENMLAYFDEVGFSDWQHKETGAPMLKVQHPEFEMWSQGTHAQAGVSCADCHMPYQRVGALKISDHHVRSPLLNINNACQTCHKVSEDNLLKRTEIIQDRHVNLVHTTLDALVDLIDDIKEARVKEVSEDKIKIAQDFQRKASFYVDYVEAENSSGFHAAQEAARILGESINFSRQGQLALR
ncbi:MAG: ammonia-forming cytochrome c nitrite reductase subunit c552 [Candidatus Scalindua sp.]